MSTLTGQQIKDTYQGLLKLADSTTGITSTYQEVQDGLGSNTNSKISTRGITSPNIFNLPNLTGNRGGFGWQTAVGVNYATDEYDSLVAFPFWDGGVNLYTGVSYSISAVTSTSDVVEIGFYTSQYDNTRGIIPYELVGTGATLTVNSTGTKTSSFTNPISFSAYGQGLYFCVIRTTNAGSTPTVKFRASNHQSNFATFLTNFYNTSGNLGSMPGNGSGAFSATACVGLWNGSVSQWESVFSGSTITTYSPYQSVMLFPGFVLRA